MRVCDVNNFYSPRGGGVKTYHQQKLDFFLGSLDHEYTLIHAGEKEACQELSPRVRAITVPGIRMNKNYRFTLDAVRLRKELNRLSPDVVEVGEPYFLPWVARVASLGKRWPLVGYWHADFPRAYVERPISRVSPWAGRVCGEVAWWYARRTYGSLDAVFASSAVMAGILRKRGLAPVFETPLGVDTSLFNPTKRDAGLRQSVGAGDESIVFIFPHRLVDEKGLNVVLEAFEAISETCDAVLVLAGAGPGEARVRAYASSHSKVAYVGYLSDRELVARWYASADVLFSLCPFETFGLATVEALASGCGVVGSDEGVIAELIARSGAGVAVPASEPGSVVAATVEFVGDRARLSQARAQGRGYAEREFSWAATFSRMLDCYAEVLG